MPMFKKKKLATYSKLLQVMPDQVYNLKLNCMKN